ncbi:MAG: hypothetical protein IJV04_08495, partial [Lachnospiraceae bacterium]|nr:hypothetical protein [Lachnospiraceae bacterium]
MNFVNIPKALKDTVPFCTWKYEKRRGEKKPTKVPYTPGKKTKAATDDPSTFGNFNSAMKAYTIGGYDGIGIRVSNGIGAIDIDHCIREDGSLNDIAAAIMKLLPTAYFEKSPSGNGLRSFFRLDPDFVYDKTVYYINNRSLGLEVYMPGATNRFVTVTGDEYRAGDVPEDMDAVHALLDNFMKRKVQVTNKTIEPCSYLTDEQVIKHATSAANGEKFRDFLDGNWQQYYDNQSDADMSFVSMLCFWCGNDSEQIDRIVRNSGMMRSKWDRQQSGSTYGAITIRNAVASNGTIYMPIQTSADDDFDNIESTDDSAGGIGVVGDGDGEEQKAEFRPDLSRITLTLEELKPHSNPRYGRDEIGIGNAFADYFKPIARYNRDRGIWYVFDGAVWRPDEGALAVAELAKLLADKLYSFALQIKDEDTRNRYIKRVQKLQMRKNRRTMVEDAKSVHPVSMKAFDRNTQLFNCKNGTLDLRTFEFRAHDPADFLTMLSGITYDPEASCPRWEQFIDEVMVNDGSLASYLQKSLGYALTGDTSLECLFILYGATSRNGKGTTMETYLKIMGDYGKTSNPEMLSAKFGSVSNASGPSEEIARLAGVRFVNISEPEKRISFNAALVKRMTGNDTLNARFLHENSFDFRPEFKIFINTNHLPNVTDMTLFESGRLKIIPFKRHFNEDEQDKGLKNLFSEDGNLSGIFNWCLNGLKEFRRSGLVPPEAVSEATDEYRKDSDRIAQFIEAWFEKDERSEVRTSAAYKLYRTWCEKYGYHTENVKNFNNAMSTHFVIRRKRPDDGVGGPTTMIIGVRMLEEELGEESDESKALQEAK